MPRRGENIYKRKDHRWEARYIRGCREDGSAIYGYCYARTYRDAKQKLKESQNQKQAQNDATRAYQPRCFAEYCEEWLQLSRTRVKESSYVKYSGVLEKHIIPRLGSYQPEEISSVMVEEFSYALLHEAGLSAKTVRDILGILQSVMRHARSQYPEQMARLQIVYPKKRPLNDQSAEPRRAKNTNKIPLAGHGSIQIWRFISVDDWPAFGGALCASMAGCVL